MKYRSLKKKCKYCQNVFIATRVSQQYCSKECLTESVRYKNILEKEKRELRYKEQSLSRKMDDRKKESDKFWENPNIIVGKQGAADYLNIGLEEILRRWKDIPFQKKEWVKTGKRGRMKSHVRLYILKEDLDAWADDVGYWKFKETVVKNYKEPLKKVPEGKGYGFLGAVTTTRDGDGIQCHICGKFFMHLSGHVNQTHKMNTKQYKEKFNLAYSTPLTSDNYREVLKIKQLEAMKQMTPAQKEAFIHRRNGYKPHHHKQTLETKNKRGVCPDQLIDQIRQCEKALGHTPSKGEFISHTGTQRFVHKIYETFGSWKKAVEIAGLAPAPEIHEILNRREYDEEELLEYLKIFYEQTNKSPTATDWHSHDLPSYNAYVKKFGSIKNARELAEVPHPKTSRKGKRYVGASL